MRQPFLIRGTDDGIEEVRGHFAWQTPEIEVASMQKVHPEAVPGTRHGVRDIHTNKDRWRVIPGSSNPTLSSSFRTWTLS